MCQVLLLPHASGRCTAPVVAGYQGGQLGCDGKAGSNGSKWMPMHGARFGAAARLVRVDPTGFVAPNQVGWVWTLSPKTLGQKCLVRVWQGKLAISSFKCCSKRAVCLIKPLLATRCGRL